MEFSTFLNEIISYICYDFSYFVSTDMGMSFIFNIFSGSMFNKNIKDVFNIPVFDSGSQFGIRKSSGSSFSILNVAVGI